MNLHLCRTAFIVGLWAAAAGAMAAGGASATTEIYQQRDADGHAVFTDRPSAKSVTERTWQMSREDPADAQQRAFEVKREAALVSERVQRIIEAQARRSSNEDMLRMQLAAADRRYANPYLNPYDDSQVDPGFAPYGPGYVVGYAPARSNGFRGPANQRPFANGNPSRGQGGHSSSMFKGPAAPGSR